MNKQHQYISSGIIQSISKLKEDREFEDLKVNVEGDIYFCHSLILASCSEFFRCLLRTDMKEKQKMEVELTNISSLIFESILNSLYTGCELLTKGNIFGIWSAVHQLQIQFLIEHCENFALENLSLETLEDYKRQAEYLSSVKVCQSIIDFICINFEQYKSTESMLRLNFQDFSEIIKSDKLKVKSEDEVLYSIYDWVSCGDSLTNAVDNVTVSETKPISQSSADETDAIAKSFLNETNAATSQTSALNIPATESCLEMQNVNSQILTQCTDSATEKKLSETDIIKLDLSERKKMLVHLLKSTRYVLASQICISQLCEDYLTQNDPNVKDIFFQAVSFKCSSYWLGYYPPSAIQRNCSNLQHVGVYANSDKVKALCFKEDEWVSIGYFPTTKESLTRKACRMTVFNGEMYAFTFIDVYTTQIIKYVNNKWKILTDFNFRSFWNGLLLSNDKYIYSVSNQGIYSFNPNNIPIDCKISKVSNLNSAQHAFTFYHYIVIFSSGNNENQSNVCLYNTETEGNEILKSIKFSSENMASFRDDRNAYILDSNGNLWKLTTSRNISFTFVAKLWSEKFEIKGALLFRETLFIFSASPNKIDVIDKVEEIFSSIRIKEVTDDASNVIHFVKEK